MTAAGLLAVLRARGIELRVDEGRLRFRAPAGAMTAELQAAVAGLKGDLLASLSPQPSAAEDRHEPFSLTELQQAYWLGEHPLCGIL